MTVKKNETQETIVINQEQRKSIAMEKLTNAVNLILRIKEVISIASIIALWLLALWFTNKLAPFVQSDRDADFRITAVETDVGSIKDDLKIMVDNISSIKSDTAYIKGQLSK